MAAELEPGAVVAGYRIEALAGRGGMGLVYRATQLSLGRPVALKLIASDLAEDVGFRERFKQESQVAAAIDHPNVIPVYEAGEDEGRLFITMRYVDGTDLRTIITDEGAVDPARTAGIVRQVGAGLDAAHARGLVHRDVKPGNILVTGEDHVYLTDFGLTKQLSGSADLTKTGQFVGTLDYMPPEQIEGRKLDARADVYALGCVLYHAVTGAVPYVRDSEVAKMWAHMNDPPPVATEVREGVPRALNDVIRRSMAKDPDERFPSAGDLGTAAVAAVEGTSLATSEVSVARGQAAAQPDTPPPAPPTEAAPTARVAEPTAAAAPPSKPDTRRRGAVALVAAGAVGVTAAALAIGGVFGGGTGKSAGKQAGGRVSTPVPAAAIKVGRTPDGVAVDEQGRAWVVLEQTNEVARIDVAKQVIDKVPVGPKPDSVAVGKGVVWVTDQGDDTVKRIDLTPNPVPGATIKVGGVPHGIALGQQLVWVVNRDSDSVSRIDRASATLVGDQIGVGGRPRQVAIGAGNVWVTNFTSGTVTQIDVSSSQVINPGIPVGKQPRGVVEAFGSVWVANSGEESVTRLDAATGRAIGSAIQVGRAPFGIAAGEGFVWVTNSKGNTVSRIDPKTGTVVGKSIPVGTEPHGIAVGGGSVWVANYGGDTVTRIKP